MHQANKQTGIRNRATRRFKVLFALPKPTLHPFCLPCQLSPKGLFSVNCIHMLPYLLPVEFSQWEALVGDGKPDGEEICDLSFLVYYYDNDCIPLSLQLMSSDWFPLPSLQYPKRIQWHHFFPCLFRDCYPYQLAGLSPPLE